MRWSGSLPLPETDEELADLIDAADEERPGHLPDEQTAARVCVGPEGEGSDEQQYQDARKQVRRVAIGTRPTFGRQYSQWNVNTKIPFLRGETCLAAP